MNSKDIHLLSKWRKLKIFEALSAGIMRLPDIYTLYFQKADGNLVCRRVFTRVIKKLVDDEYISVFDWRDADYRNGVVRLAILQHRGADYLCVSSNMERDHIRMKLPRVAHMRHDLILSNIIRNIRAEERLQKIFAIHYLVDDRAMRRALWKKGARGKNFYLPDLCGRIKVLSDGVTLNFNLELDAGNKGRKYWSLKVGSWSDPTVVITLTPRRAEIMADYARQAKRSGKVCIITLDEFCETGLRYFIEAFYTPLDNNVYQYGVNI